MTLEQADAYLKRYGIVRTGKWRPDKYNPTDKRAPITFHGIAGWAYADPKEPYMSVYTGQPMDNGYMPRAGRILEVMPDGPEFTLHAWLTGQNDDL